jgi:hypothetical protein
MTTLIAIHIFNLQIIVLSFDMLDIGYVTVVCGVVTPTDGWSSYCFTR